MKEKKLFKISIFVIISFSILMFLFAGGKKEKPAEKKPFEKPIEEKAVEKKPVELVFWIQEPQLNEFLKEVLPPIEKKYNLKVEVVQKTDDIMEQALTSASVAREGCDLYYWWTGAIAVNMAKKGMLLPLNDLFSKEKWDQMIGYETAMVGDQIYVMPTHIDWFALAYNKKIFTKYGLTPSMLDTWGGFLKVCQTLKDAGVTPLAFADKEGYISDWYLSNILPQVCESNKQMIEMLSSGDYTNPRFLEALEGIKILYDKGYFYEGGLAISFDQYNNQLLSEKAAMGIVIPWNYGGILRKEMRGVFGLQAPPAYGERKKGLVINDCSGGFFITSYTKHPKEAALLIDELTNVENSNRYYQRWGIIPGNTKWNKNLIQDPEERALLAQETARYNYNYYSSSAAYEAQLKNMSLYLQGAITAEQLAQIMIKAETE
jgi:ABC-type glycerol-3-phosphate transport system substrate-binding protein